MERPTVIDEVVQRFGATHVMAARRMASVGEAPFFDCVAVFKKTIGLQQIFNCERFLSQRNCYTHFITINGLPALTWIMACETTKEVGT